MSKQFSFEQIVYSKINKFQLIINSCKLNNSVRLSLQSTLFYLLRNQLDLFIDGAPN